MPTIMDREDATTRTVDQPTTAPMPSAIWESPIPGAKWIKDLQAAEWAVEPLSPLGATSTFETMAVARERYRGWPPIPRSYEPGHIVINGWLYMRLGGPLWTVIVNAAAALIMLLTTGIDGHRRARTRWGPRLTQLDRLSQAELQGRDIA